MLKEAIMNLARSKRVAGLTIVAGGVIGASLSFNFLGSGDVPAPDPVVVPTATVEAATPAVQRGIVTGRITDEQTGRSLAAAQVYFSGLKLGGLSQQNGKYLLLNVPTGTHTLTISRIGYGSREAQVTVGGGQTVEQNFAVAQESLQIEPIIVTVTPGATDRMSNGNTVTTVDVVAVTAQVSRISVEAGPVTVQVPITSTQQVLNASGVSSVDEPLIYIDGIRVDDPFSHPGDLDKLDPDDIESIEILRPAAAAALYGEEASVGVIQITLKR
jgi:iron complex outermembrane receptor protein